MNGFSATNTWMCCSSCAWRSGGRRRKPGTRRSRISRQAASGVLQEERQALSGESWTQGQVILSWEDALEGAAVPDDGRNVVIHEFAHQLDQQKGYANGAPWLGGRDRLARWSRVLGEEFARLQEQALAQQPSLFSYYGATSPAEFFAVVSEVFFEQPGAMASMHPALYEELRSLYRIDPAAFPVNAAARDTFLESEVG